MHNYLSAHSLAAMSMSLQVRESTQRGEIMHHTIDRLSILSEGIPALSRVVDVSLIAHVLLPQAFVVDFDAHQKARCLMYPPNRRGWNAAGHANPLQVAARGWLSAQCAEIRNFHVTKSAALVVGVFLLVVGAQGLSAQ